MVARTGEQMKSTRALMQYSLVLVALTASAADLPTADALLASSIAYHDPDGAWPTFDHTLVFAESRPDGTVRNSRVTIDLPGEEFVHDSKTDAAHVVRHVKKDDCSGLLNGSSDFTPEEASANRLTCDRMRFYRDYYTYLWGLPMKLSDPGTRIDPAVSRTTFMDREVLTLRITYDADVGGDTWYFYFDPSSHALVGYRFYHDEEKNDGEYIVLVGEYALGTMRLPKARTWYVNADDRLLGTDELVAHE